VIEEGFLAFSLRSRSFSLTVEKRVILEDKIGLEGLQAEKASCCSFSLDFLSHSSLFL